MNWASVVAALTTEVIAFTLFVRTVTGSATTTVEESTAVKSFLLRIMQII
jgi:hypothetical protein